MSVRTPKNIQDLGKLGEPTSDIQDLAVVGKSLAEGLLGLDFYDGQDLSDKINRGISEALANSEFLQPSPEFKDPSTGFLYPAYITIKTSEYINVEFNEAVYYDVYSIDIDFLKIFTGASFSITEQIEISNVILSFDISVNEGGSPELTSMDVRGIFKVAETSVTIGADLVALEFYFNIESDQLTVEKYYRELLGSEPPTEFQRGSLSHLKVYVNPQNNRRQLDMLFSDKFDLGVIEISDLRLWAQEWYGVSFKFVGNFDIGRVKVQVIAKKSTDDVWYLEGRSRESIPLQDLLVKLGAESIGLYDLNISYFRVGITKSSQETAYIFELNLAGQWTIMNGLQLEQLSLDIEHVDPSSSSHPSKYNVSGMVEIGGVHVLLSASKKGDEDGWLFQGAILSDADLMSVSTSLMDSAEGSISPLTGEDSDQNHLATLEKLSFSYHSGTKYYDFIAEVKDITLPLIEGRVFKIESLNLRWKRNESGVEQKLLGVWKLSEGREIILSADGGDNGWLFQGSLNGEVRFEEVLPLLIDDINSLGIGADTSFKDLSMTYNSQSKDFSFSGEVDTTIMDGKVTFTLKIDIKHPKVGEAEQTFSGKLNVNGFIFDMAFEKDNRKKLLLFAYHSDVGKTINLSELMEGLPEGLRLSLNDALYVYEKETTSKELFVVHMGNGINLSNLPLIGKVFPPKQSVSLNYQIIVSKGNFSTADIEQINNLMPEGIGPLERPTPSTGWEPSLAVNLSIGDEIVRLDVPLGNDDLSMNQSIQGAKTERSDFLPARLKQDTRPKGKWVPIQRGFGPVYFNQIMATFEESKLKILLDVSLSVGNLIISLDGLSVKSPLTELIPEFSLNGIGIDYRNPNVEVGGAFLRNDNEYNGLALVKLKKLSLSAIGSYTTGPKPPSLFIYAVMDVILGGPPFFFVTGLAAGFGYNRKLIVPPIEEVSEFPLITEAKTPPPLPKADDRAGFIIEKFDKLRSWIPPSPGEMFLVLGVKFTSFKIVDSVALIVLTHSKKHDEINILGASVILIPTQPKNQRGKKNQPLAQLKMAFKVHFSPQEGLLSLESRINPKQSFILSKDCRLSGGFASYQWFSGEHAGDFVITLGGYHPHFSVPSHYPNVPRLAFNWKVDKHISLKGSAFFALCPHALMAGVYLNATYHNGNLKAWFIASADFLIAWEPYHYEAHIHVEIGASYTYHFFGTHHISVSVGADLEIWGPNFGGKAKIDLKIISKTIHFGNQLSNKPKAIEWDRFQSSFLPQNEEVCSISISEGLISSQENSRADVDPIDGVINVVNPKDLVITLESVIPIKTVELTGGANPHELRTTDFGIAPMSIAVENSHVEIVIQHESGIVTRGEGAEQEEYFQLFCITKNVPLSLWGKSMTPRSNPKSKFINDALMGFEIRPKPCHEDLHEIDIIPPDWENIDNSFGWNSNSFQETTQTFTSEQMEWNRNDLLRNQLGVDWPVDCNLDQTVVEYQDSNK
ncbi:MAG: hypothetical protein ACI8RA_001900 [Chlamydiales bacterium]|jgi:hypothetical protein